jgi:AsmA protein
MTTEGQGRTGDPVGFGIPVMIEGPWDAPKIYPEMQGILDNPDAAYAKLREMGKGLFGPNGASLGGLSGLINGGANGQGVSGQGQPGGSNGQAGGLLGGQLGESIGNLLQQGLSGGLGQQGGTGAARPSQGTSQGISQGRGMSPAEPAPPAPSAPAQADSAGPQDSQPMNEVLRRLFNR